MRAGDPGTDLGSDPNRGLVGAAAEQRVVRSAIRMTGDELCDPAGDGLAEALDFGLRGRRVALELDVPLTRQPGPGATSVPGGASDGMGRNAANGRGRRPAGRRRRSQNGTLESSILAPSRAAGA